MLSGTSRFLPLTIVLTVTSREVSATSLAWTSGSPGAIGGFPVEVRVYTGVQPGTPGRAPGSAGDLPGAAGRLAAGASAFARHRHRGDADRPGGQQWLGARGQRRAGRDDVVHEDHPPARERSRAAVRRRTSRDPGSTRRELERPCDVRGPPAPVEIELGDRR